MNKLFVVMLFGMFLLSFVSAFEFDNVERYDEDTNTFTIDNCNVWIGTCLVVGDRLVTAQLTTPHNVLVARGEDRLVGEFTFKTSDNLVDVFGDIFLEDLNNGQTISRGAQYKYKEYKDVEVYDYETQCEDVVVHNGTETQCERVEVGSHFETQFEWKPINKPGNIFIPNTVYEIGVFVDVEQGDHGDWVPQFYSKKVFQWSEWTESLSTNLISYYKLDGTPDPVLDTNNYSNGTNSGATSGANGKIGNSYLFSGSVEDSFDSGLNSEIVATDWTVSFWINNTNIGTSQYIMGNRQAATANYWFIQVLANASVKVESGDMGINSITGVGTLTQLAWHHIVLRVSVNNVSLYIDGNLEGTDTSASLLTTNSDRNIRFGRWYDAWTTDNGLDGYMDEIGIWNRSLSESEVLQLYNGGDGITISFEPVVTLNSPIDNYMSSSNQVMFNGTAVSDGRLLVNMSLWTNETGDFEARNTTTVNGTTNTTTWERSFSDGSYLWNIESCDNKNNCTFGSSNRTVYIDTTFPLIDVQSPTGIYNYNYIGNTETLNVTFTEGNLDNCWYNYNGTNVTITGCLTGVKNSTTFVFENGNYNMTVYSNDTSGNENSTSVEWNYNLTEISQSYPLTAVESSTKTYTSNVTYNSSSFSVITGKLTFNGTEYTGTKSSSGDNVNFSADAIMPSVSVATNVTAYWTISLTDALTTTDYNLSSNNVTVSIINFSLCDGSNNVPFWNFTVLNESNAVEIGSTFSATFSVKQAGSTSTNEFSYSNSTGTKSQYDFCITPSAESYTIATNIQLTKPGYVDKFYNYNEVVVTSATREDNLYMMSTGDSTSFIIHVIDVSATDVEGAEVRVQRFYPGVGSWITTEIVTTNDVGETVGHLLSEDANYRFQVYQSGVSVFNSSATQITCSVAPCTVTLVIPIDVPSSYNPVENLASTLTFSSTTNTFTYTYSDSSGDFDLARLYVVRSFPTNATLTIPCNETKATVSGVITCDISGQLNGTYRASGYITRDDTEFLNKRISGVLGTSIYNSMGLDGVLWAFFIFIGIIMIGIQRPSIAIIFGIFAVIGLSLLQIINIGALSIVSIAAIGIILLMRVGRE